ATNQIAQTGLSSLPPVIYYSEQLFRVTPGQLSSSPPFTVNSSNLLSNPAWAAGAVSKEIMTAKVVLFKRFTDHIPLQVKFVPYQYNEYLSRFVGAQT
ncbi:hypothetical protein, partial [Aeromonas caviae]